MFGLDLRRLRLRSGPDACAGAGSDLLIALGREAVPTLWPASRRAVYVSGCASPVPADASSGAAEILGRYAGIVVPSAFSAEHLTKALAALTPAPVRIRVIPPVIAPTITLGTPARPPSGGVPAIVSVGRFRPGTGGERQDLLIQAFRALVARHGGALALHLVVPAHAGAPHPPFVAACQELAAGLPVTFHLNATVTEVERLVQDAALCWHAAGFGRDEAAEPWAVPQFGLRLAEEMASGAIVLAPGQGGTREIVAHGRSGFLYDGLDDLVERTERVLRAAGQDWVAAMRRAAMERSRAFSEEHFRRQWDDLLDTLLPDAARPAA